MTTGHCLCRAIAFAYDAEPRWTLNCHCESCRRATSTPMTTWISVPRAAFRFTAGAPSYYASSEGVRRSFCGKCGSPLTYENSEAPDEVHVLAGALADPNEARPSAHVFTQEQLAWFDVADALPRFVQTRRTGPPVRHGPRR
jgi:hypothetical protein